MPCYLITGVYETKYQLLIKKHESVDLKHFNDSKGIFKGINTEMTLMIFTKILMIIIKIKKVKY